MGEKKKEVVIRAKIWKDASAMECVDFLNPSCMSRGPFFFPNIKIVWNACHAVYIIKQL